MTQSSPNRSPPRMCSSSTNRNCSVLAKLFGLAGEPTRQVGALADRFSLQLVALTRGGEGSLLFSHGEFMEEAASPTTVRDFTIGAGDSLHRSRGSRLSPALAVGKNLPPPPAPSPPMSARNRAPRRPCPRNCAAPLPRAFPSHENNCRPRPDFHFHPAARRFAGHRDHRGF